MNATFCFPKPTFLIWPESGEADRSLKYHSGSRASVKSTELGSEEESRALLLLPTVDSTKSNKTKLYKSYIRTILWNHNKRNTFWRNKIQTLHSWNMDPCVRLTRLPVIPGPHRLESVLDIDQGLRRIIRRAPTHAAWPRSSDCSWVQISSNWWSVVLSTGRPWAIPYKVRASQIFVSLESLVHPVLVKNARSPEMRDWLCLEGNLVRCTARCFC